MTSRNDLVEAVRETVRKATPLSWSVIDVFELKGDRVKVILQRPDQRIGHFVIDHLAVRSGLLVTAVDKWVEQLRKEP